MFNYVKRSEFDAEHDLRVKAEARVDELLKILANSQRQYQDLMDRAMPKPTEYKEPITGQSGGLSNMSAAELTRLAEDVANTPAIGRAGMIRRAAQVTQLHALKEKVEQSEKAAARRTVDLSPEEQAEVVAAVQAA